MEIVLTNDDLTVIDGLIKKTPFEFANPFYTFFVNKIQAVQAEAQAKHDVDAAQAEAREAGAEVAEAPKKRSTLKKA